MREDVIESHLKRKAESVLGAIVYKFTAPGRRSVPDRLLLWDDPRGRPMSCFVECKAPGKKPTAKQEREMLRIASRGHWVTWVSTKEEVEDLLSTLVLGEKPENRL
ncbi:hypothetical protein [uncultured Halomonas sp.]|uniref:hypothetical protein n=1 Tax=uncultured Halomonas sp. TaxID=173971 RepID=UPI00261FFE49|nr:hypothetical protein [uncultured Halomonas sp.]